MFPKPSQMKRSHKSTKPRTLIIIDDPTAPGGRREYYSKTKAGRKEYELHTERVWIAAEGLCCICGKFIRREDLSAEHKDGRGMGGSRRDDRFILPAHLKCNTLRGSKRGPYNINATNMSGGNYANQ